MVNFGTGLPILTRSPEPGRRENAHAAIMYKKTQAELIHRGRYPRETRGSRDRVAPDIRNRLLRRRIRRVPTGAILGFRA